MAFVALSTEDYKSDKKYSNQELINYSSTNYEAITRQNALEKLVALIK
jgi:aminopeptidase N